MSTPSNQDRAIFLEAIEQQVPEKRAEFIALACGGDVDLQARVERLLRSHELLGSFHDDAPTGDVTLDQPVSEKPGTQIGPYKLLQEIGHGGMGVVYMAEQTRPVQRKVALKVIKPGMDSRQVIARFEAERQALAMMDHVNIARVLDAGTTKSGRPYFVMELVHGVPITKYCDDNHLTPRERLVLFVPVCQAIQHAHQKGIIHRDIKPSNVMITLYDGNPIPKVIDFGVAKATEQKLTERTLFTQYGMLVGTLEYMSPEQAEMSGLGVDTRSDIFSLGVLLYELLAGSTPLTRERVREAGYGEVLRMIKEEEPPKPSTRLSESGEALASISAQRHMEPVKLAKLVRGELDWIVMRALEKDRARRYETANGMAMDIQRYLADEAVLAGPPSAAYRLRKFVLRNRRPVLAAAALLVALVAGFTGTSIALVRALRAERVADERFVAVQQANTNTENALEETKQAKAATEQALKESEQARRQSQAVFEYLVETFRSPDPTMDGREIKVVDLLDRATERLNSEFSGDPAMQGKLLDTIGQTYVGLGLADQALLPLEQARALLRDALGANHPDTLNSMNNLAMAYQGVGRLQEALALYEETLKLTTDQFGPDHPDTFASMNNLATAYQDAGRVQEALSLKEETLKRQKARLGPHHPDTLVSMNNLASTYSQIGRLHDALTLCQETLDLRKAALGLDHPHTLTAMGNLASAYRAIGDFKAAIVLHDETLKLKKAKLGPLHPGTLASMNELASAYQDAGRLQDAISLHEETLKLRKAKFGPDHPHTLQSMNNLAGAYTAAQRLLDALPLYEEALKGLKLTFGPNHPETLTSMNNVAEMYRRTDRVPEALPLHEETLKLRKANLGPDDPHTLISMNNLALTYKAAGRLQDALSLQQESLELRKTVFGPDHPNTLRSMNNLAGLYKDVGRLENAVPLFEETLKLRKDRLSADHPESLESMNNLAFAYLAANQLDKAIPLLGEYLARQRKRLDRDDPGLAGILAEVGLGLLKHEQYVEAEKILRECLAIREQKQPDDWSTFNTKSMLGGSLAGQKKLAEAEPLLVSGYEGMNERQAKIPAAAKNRLAEAVQRLADLYIAWEKPAQTAQWQKKLEATTKESPQTNK